MSNNDNINITNGITGFETPDHFHGQQVTDVILNALHSESNTNDDDAEPNAKQTKYIRVTPDQLSKIVMPCSSNLLQSLTPTGVMLPHAFHPPTMTPAYYNNNKLKDY
jgi:hypothetical protein